jgi:alpha-maltose-1-phosphate synthase
MENKKTVLMAVCNYFNPDNRVFRAADTLQDSGYSVVVLSYFKAGLAEVEDPGSGFTLRRLKIRQLKIPGRRFRNFIGHLLWKEKVKIFANDYRPQYVHCHDYNTLFLGKYCSKKFKSKVVYDNHEYFQDIQYLHRYPKIVRKFIANYERRALKKFVDELIVVSPGIAESYKYLFKKTIHIVRNISDMTEKDRNTPIPEDVTNFLSEHKHLGRKMLLYLGTNTQRGRGMDFIFKLVSALPADYGLVIFGAKNDAELYYLNQKAILEGIADRFGAFMSLPIGTLFNLSSFFYMGLSLIEPIYFSYLHSLPNKLFEYISMGLPVLSSDIPDQKSLIMKYRCGIIVPFDIDIAVDLITKIQSNIFDLSRAKSELKWVEEKTKLLNVYS